jgi:hypothetical protein
VRCYHLEAVAGREAAAVLEEVAEEVAEEA